MSDLQTAKATARTQPLTRWQIPTSAFVPNENHLRDARKAEKLCEVMSAFITELYRFDDGIPRNVDPHNGYRILCYVPWAAEWRADTQPALISTERWVLRRIIRDAQRADALSLIIRDGPHHYLSAQDYSQPADALKWIDRLNITGPKFRDLDNQRRATKRKS